MSLKSKICRLRSVIEEMGLKGSGLHHAAQSIKDCPEVRGSRCDEINSLAITGFAEARHIVQMKFPAA